jgi:hypothetical protein
MTEEAGAVSSRIVIWAGASLESCSPEDRAGLSELMNLRGAQSLSDLHGLSLAELGAQADCFEKILDSTGLGQLVRIWWPGTPPPNARNVSRDPLSQSVSILDLSVRSANCLEHAGITTISELLRWTTDELLTIKNMGRKSVVEIQESLAGQGISGIPVPQEDVAPQSFCLAVLLSLQQCGIRTDTIARLHEAGIRRLDDLLVRNGGALRYWVGLTGSELMELREHLGRMGLSLDSPLPTWLRFHFYAVRNAFEGEIERLLTMDAEFTEDDEPELGLPSTPDDAAVPAQLEEELESCFAPRTKTRNRDIVRRLMGWDGKAGATLEQVGREFQLTRERVRQVLIKSLRPLNWETPTLFRRAVEFIARRTPILAEEAETELVRAGIVLQRFRIEAVEKTAREFSFPVSWSLERLNSRLVVIDPLAAGRIQEFLSAARKRVSHYGTTCREYVLTGLPCELTAEELHCYWFLVEDLVWLDEAHDWFWLPTKQNAVLSRLVKILRVAPRIRLDIARHGVLRDRRMDGVELPPGVFRALSATLPWCSIEGEELVATAAPDESPADEEDSGEQLVVEVLRQHGPVMWRRDLWRIANGHGVEKVNFDRLLSGSNVIVKHGPEVFGLIGSAYHEPPVEVPREQIEDTTEPPGQANILPIEDASGPGGVFNGCDPESPNFHEQVLRCIHLRSSHLRSSGVWSLMELGLTGSDFQTLRSWSNFGRLESRKILKQRLSCGSASYSGLEALAVTFLACCSEIARNSSSEGELWPSVEAEIGVDLRKELFAAPANPKPRIRDATESVCSKLGIRHAFGREGEQSWLRSVFLQFGITKSGWRRLSLWLSGVNLPAPVESLLGPSSGLHSDSFSLFWKTLQKLSWHEMSEKQARAELAQSRWVPASEIDALMCEAATRPDNELYRDGSDPDLPHEPDQLIGLPRLTWLDEPRFALPFNGHSSWLTAPRYALVVGGQRRIPIVRRGDEYALEAPGGRLEVDLKEAAVTVDLHLRQASCLAEPIVIKLAPEDFDFVFYNSAGQGLPNGEEKLGAATGCVLLCRSACDVTVEPPDAYVRRIFQGEWIVRSYRGAVPSELEIRREGLVLWSASRPHEPATAPRQKPRASCAGGRWGERATVSVQAPEGMVPQHLLVGETRVPLEPAANGSYRGTITLSPNVDYRRVVTRVEYEWNGRLRRLSADLTMGPLDGIAVESEQGWKVFREGGDVDAEFLRSHKVLTRLPSHYDGDPVATEGWAWMEGDHFCGRPRNAGAGTAIGSSLHGIGQSLRLSAGPYNRPIGGQELARSVIHSGVMRRVEQDGDAYQIQLRSAFELGSDHAIWVWHEGHNEPQKVPAGDWAQEDDVCLLELGARARPVALAVSFQGAWLGARTCQLGWQGFAGLISSSSDWKRTAGWLRWWRVPLLHGSLKAVAGARVLEARIATISTWTAREDLPGGARFSEEHEDAWRSVIRNFIWDWRPDADESADILKGFGLLTGDAESDIERAWDTYDVLLAIHPLLLAQAAKRGLAALFPRQDPEDLAYWLGKLRNRILGLDAFPRSDQVAAALRNAQRMTAESMAVDERFVDRSLLRDALALMSGTPIKDHDLRVAIANNQAARKYLAAALLEKMISGELR